MATFLPPLNLPEGIILLITDELSATADFVLHRTLALHLKKPAKRVEAHEDRRQIAKAVILSVSEGLGKWKALGSKANLNLQSHIDSSSLVFIDVLATVTPPSTSSPEAGSDLRKIYDLLVERLSFDVPNPNPSLLILDDISSLEWIGFPLSKIQDFIRALRSLCLKTNTTLLVRHHLLSSREAEPDELFRLLLQISAYHLEVRPLLSGRSGAVSGEICLHRGFSASEDGVKLINRGSVLQYRLSDAGPEFFAKGTSEGVL